MELTGVKLENFRSYDSTGWIPVNKKLVLVGENNAGKSNFLDALSYFFEFSRRKPHEKSDFHFDRTHEPIEMYTRFSELTEEENDIFQEYVFDGELTVKLELPYDEETDSVDTKNYFVRHETLSNENLRDIGDESVDRAIEIYEENEDTLSQYKTEDNWTDKNRASIKRVVEDYRESGDAETELSWIAPGISNDLDECLPNFTIYRADRELDDATRTSNKSSLLYQLLESAVSEVPEEERDRISNELSGVEEDINSDDIFEPIRELENELSEKLSSQINHLDSIGIETELPDLQELVTRHSKVSVGDEYMDDIDDMGSGSKMSFLFACLWEATERDTDRMMLALEEPENDLHPHAQRQLYDTLEDLTQQGHYVVLSTHSAELVEMGDVENVLRISREKSSGEDVLEKSSRVYSLGEDSLTEEEKEKLMTLSTTGKNEMFFSRAVVACEGETDRDVLPLLNSILEEHTNDVSSFDSHGISVIDAGGKENLSTYLKIASEFEIPTLSLMDDDRDGSVRDDEHESTIEDVRELSDEFYLLDDDLEHSLFEAVSIEEFHSAMERMDEIGVIPEFEYTEDEIRRAVEGGDDREKPDALKSEFFHRYSPPKPAFGRQLVKEIDDNRVPDKIERLIRESLEIAS